MVSDFLMVSNLRWLRILRFWDFCFDLFVLIVWIRIFWLGSFWIGTVGSEVLVRIFWV